MNFPEQLHYTKEHEWISLDGNVATIGITEFAQGELGDIIYVDIETIGKELTADAVFGSVEAVKTVSDLFLPVAGTITEKNSLLDSQPELVNQDPYGDGWMIKMTVSDASQLSGLLDVHAYKALIGA
jgi:glycine cleavage system H protein